jgi:benzaldehyde dehydrogenase (NAD)
LTIGDPAQGGFVLGPVADVQAVTRCNVLIEDALAKGARLVCGGPATGALIPATLLDHVTPEMKIYHEETFGPVKAIIRVRDDEQAVETANDSEFGLSAAVFSRDIGRAWQVASRIQTGICHINGPTVHDEPQMPFGGVKASGYGRFGGKSGMDAFTELRWISLQTKPRQYPF